jgi:hypothetical protein
MRKGSRLSLIKKFGISPFSVSCRIESLNMKRFQGIVKVTGIVFCFAGVIVLAFYQGPEIKSFNHHHLLHNTSNSHDTITVQPVRTWLLGIFLMTLGTIFWALWTVLQV